MKRVTYISRFSRPLSSEEIHKIAEISITNNERDGLTGVLFTYKNIFYQIIEGEEGPLDARLAKILKDDRHKDIFVLKTETGDIERHYSDWAMKTVILDENQDYLMRPISEMLSSLTDNWLILEKYTPQQILSDMQNGHNPLDRRPAPADKLILFGDLFASTAMTEKFSPDTVVEILERFFESANESIVSAGGTVSKLLGDGLLAYFPASEAQAAIEAVRKASLELKKLRITAEPGSPFSLLYSGYGLSCGKVLEGNVGSVSKKDFTVIGDAVNTAARLQPLTRKTGKSIIFDESVLKYYNPEGLKKIGRYKPKGKESFLNLYTLNDPAFANDLPYSEITEKIRSYSI